MLSDERGDTFRAVCTVRFSDVVYKGISTPQREVDLVKARLRLAEEVHRKREKQ